MTWLKLIVLHVTNATSLERAALKQTAAPILETLHRCPQMITAKHLTRCCQMFVFKKSNYKILLSRITAFHKQLFLIGLPSEFYCSNKTGAMVGIFLKIVQSDLAFRMDPRLIALLLSLSLTLFSIRCSQQLLTHFNCQTNANLFCM